VQLAAQIDKMSALARRNFEVVDKLLT
jgi:hypothetical protein